MKLEGFSASADASTFAQLDTKALLAQFAEARAQEKARLAELKQRLRQQSEDLARGGADGKPVVQQLLSPARGVATTFPEAAPAPAPAPVHAGKAAEPQSREAAKPLLPPTDPLARLLAVAQQTVNEAAARQQKLKEEGEHIRQLREDCLHEASILMSLLPQHSTGLDDRGSARQASPSHKGHWQHASETVQSAMPSVFPSVPGRSMHAEVDGTRGIAAPMPARIPAAPLGPPLAGQPGGAIVDLARGVSGSAAGGLTRPTALQPVGGAAAGQPHLHEPPPAMASVTRPPGQSGVKAAADVGGAVEAEELVAGASHESPAAASRALSPLTSAPATPEPAVFKIGLEKGKKKQLMAKLDTEMVVTQIQAGGLLHEHNQAHPETCVLVGDRIIEVNGITEKDKMLQEIGKSNVLEVSLRAGPGHAAAATPQVAVAPKAPAEEPPKGARRGFFGFRRRG
eukprot:TRINITY_DN101386_c0_g1_i1.p1 TRINITY_DN101386_c0_g1~~TRINITY_DN101386_c0_g1_i1.p1  ORF type:complete len:456 (+),score=105.31 TRINITY_DN101386_c0_g1_i1:92-1459(+)